MDHEVVSPEAPRELRARADIDGVLVGAAEVSAAVVARWGQERVEAVLGRDEGGPTLVLGVAPTVVPTTVEVTFDLGRHRYAFVGNVARISGPRLHLGFPETVTRSDRRRFARTHHPDAHRNGVRLVDGDDRLPLLDLSLNGATFVVPGYAAQGSRLPIEVMMEGHAPAVVDFEVTRAHPDPTGAGTVVSGRFLQSSLAPDEQITAAEVVGLLLDVLGAHPADLVEDALERLKTPAPVERRAPGNPS